MKKKTFKELFEESRKRDEYWIAYAKMEFTEKIRHLLEDKRETKAGLAKKLGKSPAYITKIFRGDANFTLESMVKLVRALGGRLKIEPVIEVKKQVKTEMKWLNIYDKGVIPSKGVIAYVRSGAGKNLFEWINAKTVSPIQTQGLGQLYPTIPREEKIEGNFVTA